MLGAARAAFALCEVGSQDTIDSARRLEGAGHVGLEKHQVGAARVALRVLPADPPGEVIVGPELVRGSSLTRDLLGRSFAHDAPQL